MLCAALAVGGGGIGWLVEGKGEAAAASKMVAAATNYHNYHIPNDNNMKRRQHKLDFCTL